MTRLLEPAVTAAGFDLEEVDVRPAGRRRLIRIVVDADGGVALDDVADLSRIASDLLDGSDVMGASPYVLEVTSPGVDRPLTEPRHWRRAVGRLVVAPLTEGGQVEGRVVAAGDDGVDLDVVRGKGRPAARRTFPFAALGPGKVQVEFRRADETQDDADEAVTDTDDPADDQPDGAGGGAAAPRSPAEPD
ncbi:ribosome maturation factor RimP [Actinomadura atramentaria]|uniref:ribosome maturation factor RimP n=1 Tax=Actinomadura atramentaria TaxID=1990 RepID=UPI000684A7F6|nr:ribosome maturation factor RimP [Actinomadura atramentaria]